MKVYYLRCPKCQAVLPISMESSDEAFEEFVGEHLPHLGDEDYLVISEAAGDC